MSDLTPATTRRHALQAIGLSVGFTARSWGQPAPPAPVNSVGPGLPLKNTGLEHYGLTVPNPEAAARFYGKIFDNQLFREKDPPPRFYVRLGKAYLAFGQRDGVAPFIDHFCALTDGYGRGEARKAMEDAGMTFGTGPLGMAADPDGLRFQLLAVPGGLAGTIVPGGI